MRPRKSNCPIVRPAPPDEEARGRGQPGLVPLSQITRAIYVCELEFGFDLRVYMSGPRHIIGGAGGGPVAWRRIGMEVMENRCGLWGRLRTASAGPGQVTGRGRAWVRLLRSLRASRGQGTGGRIWALRPWLSPTQGVEQGLWRPPQNPPSPPPERGGIVHKRRAAKRASSGDSLLASPDLASRPRHSVRVEKPECLPPPSGTCTGQSL